MFEPWFLEQFETKLSPICEKQCVKVCNGECSRDQSMPISFRFNFFNLISHQGLILSNDVNKCVAYLHTITPADIVHAGRQEN